MKWHRWNAGQTRVSLSLVYSKRLWFLFIGLCMFKICWKVYFPMTRWGVGVCWTEGWSHGALLLNRHVNYMKLCIQIPRARAFWFQTKRYIKQDGGHGGHLGFPIGTILAIFIYKSPRCFLLSLKSISLSIPDKKQKIDFQDGRHGRRLGFPIRKSLAIFDL